MGKGGFRFGAGRPATHVRDDQCRHIDVRRWQREGMLLTGYAWSWAWSDPDTGQRTASISLICLADAVELNYRLNGAPIRQHVSILRTPCHYGKDRPWFGCPACGRRVALLYLRGSGFFCRHCARVAYRSQSEDACGRSWIKQHKVEAKLDRYWQRPKGMHHRTHARLMSVIIDCELQRDLWLIETAERLGFVW